jgi:DNA-binding HxlR family transcriptional regulator
MSDVTESCPLTAAVEIIGGKWSLIVLYALSHRSCRFNELQRLAPGVSHKVLTETVRALECHGLVNRDVGDGPVPCVWYSLSAYGQTLRPVIDAITEWGSQHLNASTARHPANDESTDRSSGTQPECAR